MFPTAVYAVRRLAHNLLSAEWKKWLVSCAAMIISTYALDLAATTAGLLLVASGALASIPLSHTVLFLLASYAVWGAGLYVNLGANWELLRQTGTSTNILSKAGYDFVRRMQWNERLQRGFAGAGYVMTELAKEAPYYAAALGAAFTGLLPTQQAIVFLAGANLGAAAYEYGLARLVLASLNRWKLAQYASFETEWKPQDYLDQYYRTVEPDERQTIAFFVDAINKTAPGHPVLIFGVGPTLHHVFLAADKASEIHLGDYLEKNLQEIEKWIERDPLAHDWTPFIRYTLQCEGLSQPDAADIARREEITRARIRKLMPVDLRLSNPLGGTRLHQYHTVISAYCADSSTSDQREWRNYMRRIAGLVRPGGTLLIAALRRSQGYAVGARTFPSAGIDEHDVLSVLEPFARHGQMTVKICNLQDAPARGFSSIVLASVSATVV